MATGSAVLDGPLTEFLSDNVVERAIAGYLECERSPVHLYRRPLYWLDVPRSIEVLKQLPQVGYRNQLDIGNQAGLVEVAGGDDEPGQAVCFANHDFANNAADGAYRTIQAEFAHNGRTGERVADFAVHDQYG